MFRKVIFFMCLYAALTYADLPENNESEKCGRIEVTIRPFWSIVKIGGSAKMECIFEPKDAYIITWWKFDNETFKPIGENAELQLWNITRKNEGLYACIVSKMDIQGSSNAYLQVIE